MAADQTHKEGTLGDRIRFARGLSGSFLRDLQHGRFRGLLAAATARGLDVQIRENYIDIYSDGRGVLNLSEKLSAGQYVAKLHWKYLPGVRLPCGKGRSGEYCFFTATDDFVASYLASFDAVIDNTRPYLRREAAVEEKLVKASCAASSPVVFIDRQIQVHGQRRRADLLGVASLPSGGAIVVLAELKVKLDNRIQSVHEALGEYYRIFTVGGHLAQSMGRAYRTVVAQKQALGLLPPTVRPPDGAIPAECLIVLYDYNPASDLLGRLRRACSGSGIPMRLAHLSVGEYSLPAREMWEEL